MPDAIARVVPRTGVRRYSWQELLEGQAWDVRVNIVEAGEGVEAAGYGLFQVFHLGTGWVRCSFCTRAPIKRAFLLREIENFSRARLACVSCAEARFPQDVVARYVAELTRYTNQARSLRRQRAAEEAVRQRQEEARRNWQENYADVENWLLRQTDRESDFYRLALCNRGYLLPNQATSCRRLMEEANRQAATPISVAAPQASSTSIAAEWTDLPSVPNGTYSLVFEGVHYTFLLHTPRNGALQGKRVLKKQDSMGVWKGFAFLGREGQFALWRRFQHLRNEPVMLAAAALCSELARLYTGSCMVRRCRRCNTDSSYMVNNLCRSCTVSSPRPARVAAPRAPFEHALCELGTGELQ